MFEGYLSLAGITRAYLDDRWTDQDRLHARTQDENQLIMMQYQLPSYYKNPFADDNGEDSEE